MPNSIVRETVVTEISHCNRAPKYSKSSLSQFILFSCAHLQTLIAKEKSRELFTKEVGEKSQDSMIAKPKSVQQHTALNKLILSHPVSMHNH